MSPVRPSTVTRSAAPASPRRWLTVVVALATFVAGVAIGSAVTLLIVRNFVRERILTIVRAPEKAPDAIAGRIQSKLGLSDTQTGQVRQVILRHQPAFEAIFRDAQTRLEAELDATKQDIAATLGPREAERWATWFDDLRRSWLPQLPVAP